MLNTSNDQRKLLPNFEQLFATTAQAPGGVARLRELILTLAVQGKLVAQDPSDEPASELLKKIRAEKDRLIAEGKIKKDKPLAEITDEEKPFELPVGWAFERLGEICQLNYGKNLPTSSLLEEGFDVFGANGVIGKYSKYLYESKKLLISCRGAYSGKANISPEKCFITNNSIVCDFYGENFVDINFFHSQLTIADKSKIVTGSAQPQVTVANLAPFVIAIPPAVEQSRIVTRVKELMHLCDALEEKGRLEHTQHQQLLQALLDSLTQTTDAQELALHWQRLAQHFDLLIDRPEAVDALEQTILQLAVRGLLVPQDPSDEPASELLKKIRAEKDRLIAEGKIKKDKRSKTNHDFLEPFPLPSGWEWATFPELGEFGRGKSKHRPRNDPQLFNPPIYPLVQTGEVARANGIVQEFHSKYSEFGLAQSRLWPKGTLCITIAANIADAAILGFDACFPDSVVGFIPYAEKETVKYFLAFMETAKAEISAYAPATAQKNINLEILEAIKIPIPPIAEQSRIVARVTELRALCQQLREKLTQARTTQTQLAQAWVEQVAG